MTTLTQFYRNCTPDWTWRHLNHGTIFDGQTRIRSLKKKLEKKHLWSISPDENVVTDEKADANTTFYSIRMANALNDAAIAPCRLTHDICESH